MPRFGSVVTAMVTPFDGDGALDLDGAATLARHLVATGSDGLVVAGTTGEGPVLTDAERMELLRAVAGAVDVPVIASTGTNDTAHSVTLTKAAKLAGVGGVLVVTPYYNRPSAAGLSAHFRAVAAATDLPVVLYDIPVRSGRRIGAGAHPGAGPRGPNIVGVKDATGDLAAAARWWPRAPEGFEVYCGDDSLTLPFVVGRWGRRSSAWPRTGPARLFAEMIGSLPRRGRASGPWWSTSAWASPTVSSPATSSPTRCRPRPPAGPWACPWASAACPTHPPRRARRAGRGGDLNPGRRAAPDAPVGCLTPGATGPDRGGARSAQAGARAAGAKSTREA